MGVLGYCALGLLLRQLFSIQRIPGEIPRVAFHLHGKCGNLLLDFDIVHQNEKRLYDKGSMAVRTKVNPGDAGNNGSALLLDPEACWGVVERVAASSHLTRATRLREFLFYVGSKSIKEGCRDVHEQEIGHAVFGRRESYDTSQDNIVRVSATELRKRIDAYFAGEGKGETLVFEIPRGGYTPVFKLREPNSQPEESVPTVVTEQISLEPQRTSVLPLALLSILVVAMGIACLVLWQQNQSLNRLIYPWEGKPALASFWPRFFHASQATDIVLADSSFTLTQDLLKQSFSLSDYLNRSYASKITGVFVTTDAGTTKAIPYRSIVTRNSGSFGDFSVALRIRLLDPSARQMQVVYARDYTSDLIKRDNVILIGSSKANPWLDLFSNQMDFQIKYDANLDQTFIANLHPRAGEQSIYAQPLNVDDPLGYSVIAYLPNLSHTASALIIEGTNSQATNAAGDFVTSESAMASFLKHFPAGKIPYFEILLKTTRMSDTPLQEEVVAYRTH